MDHVALYYAYENEDEPSVEVNIDHSADILYLDTMAEMILRFLKGIGFDYVTGVELHKDCGSHLAGSAYPKGGDDLDVA